MAITALPSPPIEPMLAKIAEALPAEPGFLFEPKWDGFRALVFRGGEQTYMQSRDLRPLNRYFPELEKALHGALPKGCILDGEIVVATPRGLDFDALQLRLHPAASRVAKLAKETPARFVAFDLLGRRAASPPGAAAGRAPRAAGAAAGQGGAAVAPDAHDARPRRSRALAAATSKARASTAWWPSRSPPPTSRASAPCSRSSTCAAPTAWWRGFRWYKEREDAVGSLLLGLYDDAGTLQHVGVASSSRWRCASSWSRNCSRCARTR